MAVDHTNVKEVLEAAHKAVKEAKVPEALQAAAFEKAIDLLATQAGLAATVAPALPATPPVPDAAATPPVTPPAPGAPKTLDAVAAKLKVPVEDVSEVFHLEGEDIALSLATSQLPEENKQAVEQIALLVTAVRQAGGWDAEWTPVSVIRPVAENYGKADTNFSTYVKEMDDEFSFTGGGRTRRVKLRRRGLESAGELVKQLAGGD